MRKVNPDTSVDEDYIMLEKSNLIDVVDYLYIPDQRITLNKNNISHYAEGVESALRKPNTSLRFRSDIKPKHLKDPWLAWDFESKPLSAYTRSGGHVTVTLDGYLGIDPITLDSDYSVGWGYGSYHFYLATTVETCLVAEMAAIMNEEVVIPLLGLDAGVGNVGNVTAGLFLIVGIDGQFTLQVEARDWCTIEEAGIKGKTVLGIPVTFRPKINATPGASGDAEFFGQVSGYMKAGALADLELDSACSRVIFALFRFILSCASRFSVLVIEILAFQVNRAKQGIVKRLLVQVRKFGVVVRQIQFMLEENLAATGAGFAVAVVTQ